MNCSRLETSVILGQFYFVILILCMLEKGMTLRRNSLIYLHKLPVWKIYVRYIVVQDNGKKIFHSTHLCMQLQISYFVLFNCVNKFGNNY